jgi:hypothetical protein
MPVTGAKSAFGVIFLRNGNEIGELTEIGDLELTQGNEDVTHHQSPGRYAEKIGTILDGGKVPMKGNFIPGDTLGQVGMKTDMEAGTVQTFELRFPAAMGTSFTFTALVTKWKIPGMPVDKSVLWECEVEITGQPVLTITASAGLTGAIFTVSGAGTLIVPTASGSVYEYVINIGTAVSAVTITPTAAAGVITIVANGASQVVTTGAASTAITLGAAGSVTEATVSVQEASKVAKVYTLYLCRAA